ncbi:MAG: hypothetical protein ACRD4Y_07710 [Candidatus Acidiferrales bacterium]
MRPVLGFLAVLLVSGPSISYFEYQRTVQVPAGGGQTFAVVDEAVWKHARPDLNDIRLYSGHQEVPYAREMERGGSEAEEKECRVLQPARVGGKTVFLLDMSGAPEYNHVTLKLSARNYIAHAVIEGQNDPRAARWAVLGTTTLYDLSAEKLGSNSTLQFPTAIYKYMKVTVDGAIKPGGVQDAAAGITSLYQAAWKTIDAKPHLVQEGSNTVVMFSRAESIPVERVLFEVDPAQRNFRREVEIQGTAARTFVSGEISRIHMQRLGQQIDSERLWLGVGGNAGRVVNVIVHNGDDVPLKITGVSLQQYERRIYFEAKAGMPIRMYYGDPLLPSPIYDYSKLFQKDSRAVEAALGSEEKNKEFTGRPDERPLSERYPALLWLAILMAVLTLGALAMRSLRAAGG